MRAGIRVKTLGTLSIATVMLIAISCGTSAPTVGPLRTRPLPVECGCVYWEVGSTEEDRIFDENVDRSEVWIHINHKDRKAIALAEHVLADGRSSTNYSVDSIDIQIVVTTMEKECGEDCEWVRQKGEMLIRSASGSRRIRIEGGCGC